MANSPVLNVLRVNFAEEDGWARYDSARELDGYHDNAHDMFIAYRDQDSQEWVRDLTGAKSAKTVQDWTPKNVRLSDEEVEILAVALAEKELSETSQAVIDAMGWAWEEAYIPTDRDVKYAMEQAIEEVAGKHSIFYYGFGEELWEPLLGERSADPPTQDRPTKWTPGKILESILSAIEYEREQQHFDRFFVLDPSKSEAVRTLLKFADRHPRMPAPEFVFRLNGWLRSLFSDEFLAEFFKTLEKQMGFVDISGRVSFGDHWKSLLKDKFIVKAAQEEMMNFLREKGDLEENQARLLAKVILGLANKGKLSEAAAEDLHGPEKTTYHHAQTIQEAAKIMGFSRGQIERYLG